MKSGKKNRVFRPSLKNVESNFGSHISIGLELAIFLLFFIFLGRYLDMRWGTTPWLLILGSLLGFAAGFYNLIRTLSRLDKKNQPGKEHKKS